jgi:hypothetical protein
VAGPTGESLGLPVVFLIAGVAPLVIGVVAIMAARMTRDEVAHPPDAGAESDEAAAVADGFEADLVPTVSKPRPHRTPQLSWFRGSTRPCGEVSP